MRWFLLVLMVSAGVARADDLYLVDHPDARWWLSAQANSILQAQPGFQSPYEGDNSFRPDDHAQISYVATVFAGYELTSTTTIVVTGESAGGGGLSTALGLAGFTNLDVVRNPSLGPAPYFGRAFVTQIIPLDDTMETSDRNPLRIFHRVPAHRIEIHAGKISTVDFFDVNTVGADSHLQFMNWTVDNNGAYDYAADTRGYTVGAVVEYIAPEFAVRYGAMLMPTVANGIDYDTDVAHARGEQLELEVHPRIAGRPGVVRVLGYWNHARMGRYADAIATVRQGIVDTPDVTQTRVTGRLKYGVGINAEQELPCGIRAFMRFGWNEGENESFAYTEVDNTVLAGADWRHGAGKLGVAAVSNGISDSHREYLQLGGKGFILGDGTLHYGRENILEAYYTLRAVRGVFPAADVQVIDSPGYNTDRGPVVVGSLRLHVEI